MKKSPFCPLSLSGRGVGMEIDNIRVDLYNHFSLPNWQKALIYPDSKI